MKPGINRGAGAFRSDRPEVDRFEIKIGAHETALAFRKADSFEPQAGQADLLPFATRCARALVFGAGAEQARGDDAPAAGHSSVPTWYSVCTCEC